MNNITTKPLHPYFYNGINYFGPVATTAGNTLPLNVSLMDGYEYGISDSVNLDLIIKGHYTQVPGFFLGQLQPNGPTTYKAFMRNSSFIIHRQVSNFENYISLINHNNRPFTAWIELQSVGSIGDNPLGDYNPTGSIMGNTDIHFYYEIEYIPQIFEISPTINFNIVTTCETSIMGYTDISNPQTIYNANMIPQVINRYNIQSQSIDNTNMKSIHYGIVYYQSSGIWKLGAYYETIQNQHANYAILNEITCTVPTSNIVTSSEGFSLMIDSSGGTGLSVYIEDVSSGKYLLQDLSGYNINSNSLLIQQEFSIGIYDNSGNSLNSTSKNILFTMGERGDGMFSFKSTPGEIEGAGMDGCPTNSGIQCCFGQSNEGGYMSYEWDYYMNLNYTNGSNTTIIFTSDVNTGTSAGDGAECPDYLTTSWYPISITFSTTSMNILVLNSYTSIGGSVMNFSVTNGSNKNIPYTLSTTPNSYLTFT